MSRERSRGDFAMGVAVLLLLAQPALLSGIALPARCAPLRPVVRARAPFPAATEPAEPAEPAAEPAVDADASVSEKDDTAEKQNKKGKKGSEEKQQLKARIAELERALTKARGDVADAKDGLRDAGEPGYMLLAADFERFRRSARDDLRGQEVYGTGEGLKAILPFVDTFGALQAQAEEADCDGGAIHQAYGGVHKQLVTLLESLKVEPFEPDVGEKFDPDRHVKVDAEVTDEAAAGCVLEVRNFGYVMDRTVIRQAEVLVSEAPQAEEEEESADEAEAVGEEEGGEEAEAVADDGGEEGDGEGGKAWV